MAVDLDGALQRALMRVGINGYFWGQETTGSGQYLSHLLRSLLAITEEDFYALFVPANAYASQHVLRDALAAENLSLVPVPVSVPHEDLGKLWFEQVTFPLACRGKGLDLIHVPYFASPLIPPVPTVVTIHDLIPLLLPSYRGDIRVRLYMRLVSLAARRADAILTDSEASARDIVRTLHIPVERVHVVYLAADEHLKPIRDQEILKAFRARYELPERYMLYLGGFDPRRNIATLLRALAHVIEILGNRGFQPLPCLVLAGPLPAKDTTFAPDPRRLVEELGIGEHVRYIGPVAEPDKPLLYSGADLFVFPSLYEGFGLTPLEAMACGVPVIASNTSSLPEVVGEGGLLVNALDVEGWSQAIVALWTQPERRRSLYHRALRQAARFSWQRTAEQTLDVYRQVLKSKQGR